MPRYVGSPSLPRRARGLDAMPAPACGRPSRFGPVSESPEGLFRGAGVLDDLRPVECQARY